jgi:hypothetical protein
LESSVLNPLARLLEFNEPGTLNKQDFKDGCIHSRN